MARSTCTRPDCTEVVRGRGLCNTHYATHRRRMMAYEKWQPEWVPAGPTAQHLQTLRDKGIGWRQLSRLSGIHVNVLQPLVVHNHDMCARRTEERVLSIPIPTDAELLRGLAADGAFLSPVGTQRRLRALARFGYPNMYLAELLGIHPRCLSGYTSGRFTKVTARRARQIADLFDQLHMTPGPSDRVRRRAASMGWLPPLSWDEETIDNPKAGPARKKPIVTFDRAEQTDELRRRINHLTASGLTATEIAVRLQITRRTVERHRNHNRELRSAS